MIRNLILFVIVVFFVCSTVTPAYTVEEIQMEEVVVSATKTPEERKDIPNAVVLVDKMDIQNSPAKTIGELLANELGIDWRTLGNYGGAIEEVHIRGMTGSGTQVLVNGVSINSPSLGVADVGRIPLNTIERIEVVKGSGSLLYGSGAMGGTINIITKRPERDKIDCKVSAGYGSNDAYVISAEQGMFIADDIGYCITANRKETDGFRDNGDLDHKYVSLKLVWEKGDALDISLYGDYIDREYGRTGAEPPDGTQSYFVNGVEVYNNEAASLLDRGSDEDAHLILQIKSKPSDHIDFSLRGDYTTMENYNYSRYVASSVDLPGYKTWVTNDIYGAEGNVNITPFEGAGLLLGVEHKKFVWENDSIDLDGTGAEDNSSKSLIDENIHTTGMYAEAQYRPSMYIKLLAGIRQEKHSEFGTENIPLWGLIVNPEEDTILKVSHGKHFLAPTPNDLFWPYEDYGFLSLEGNSDLRPETGWHTDFTIEHTIVKNRAFASVSYAHWDVEGKILWEPDSNFHYSPVNLDSFKANIIEVGVKLGPFRNMIFSFDFTYTDAEEENEFVTRQATYVAKSHVKSGFTYWTDFGLTVSTTIRHTGKRPYYGSDKTIIVPTATLNSYWTMDLKLEQYFFEHWVFSLVGTNLFDEEYDTYFDPFTDQTTSETELVGYPGAGRSVFFTVGYEF